LWLKGERVPARACGLPDSCRRELVTETSIDGNAMKSSLLCSYASENSPQAKIDRWISELLDYRRVGPDDSEQAETVDLLLSKVRSWATNTPSQ
jgi:hypothetical protein